MAVTQRDVSEVGGQKADIAIQSHLLGGGRIGKLETDHDFPVLEMGRRNSERIGGKRFLSERPFTDGFAIDVNQHALLWKPVLHQKGRHGRAKEHHVVFGMIHLQL